MRAPVVPAVDPALGHVFLMTGNALLVPASCWIAIRAESLTLAARNPQELSRSIGAEPVKFDWSSNHLARRSLAARKGRFDVVVIWLPDEASALVRPMEDVVRPGGRVIRVHDAPATDPLIRRLRDPDPRDDVVRQTVVLEATGDQAADKKTKMSDIEVLGGVIAALRDPTLSEILVGSSGS